MAVIYSRGNDALNVNPYAGDQHLTEHGSNWLWAVMALFVLSFLVLAGLVWVARAGEKIFHYLFIIALLVASIVYFAQAADLAWDVVPQANHVFNGTRQIFWAKYVNWVVSFPVIIIAIGLLSGISWATIFYNVFLSWVWIISYLVGAYTRTNYKWGFFAFGTFAWLLLAVHMLRFGSLGAKRLEVTRDHSALAGWVNLLWLLYPIAWALTDGSNYLGVTQEFVWFGILDILLIIGTAFAFIFLARKWDYNRLNIAFTQYGRVYHRPGTFPEKGGNNVATPAAPGAHTA